MFYGFSIYLPSSVDLKTWKQRPDLLKSGPPPISHHTSVIVSPGSFLLSVSDISEPQLKVSSSSTPDILSDINHTQAARRSVTLSDIQNTQTSRRNTVTPSHLSSSQSLTLGQYFQSARSMEQLIKQSSGDSDSCLVFDNLAYQTSQELLAPKHDNHNSHNNIYSTSDSSDNQNKSRTGQNNNHGNGNHHNSIYYDSGNGDSAYSLHSSSDRCPGVMLRHTSRSLDSLRCLPELEAADLISPETALPGFVPSPISTVSTSSLRRDVILEDSNCNSNGPNGIASASQQPLKVHV